MREIIGEKEEFKKIFNYFLETTISWGSRILGTRYSVFNLKL